MTQVETGTTVFGDRLVDCVDRRRSQLVLGLDPVVELLPVELQGDAGDVPEARADAVARFCRGLIDAAAPSCVAVKPQLAFFEALGSHGMRAFENACAYAREAGLLVIADAKRGDIGSTARAYAAAYVEPRDGGPPVADAITVNPYLGRESVEPFLGAASATAPASSSSRRRRTRAAPTSRISGSATARSSGRASRGSRASGARITSASTASRASGS